MARTEPGLRLPATHPSATTIRSTAAIDKEARGHEICLWRMIEPPTDEVQDPGPQGWCVCGQKVTIADPREVTLPNGRPGWEGHCPQCGSPLFAIRRKAADS
jgi:hypothetical protein